MNETERLIARAVGNAMTAHLCLTLGWRDSQEYFAQRAIWGMALAMESIISQGIPGIENLSDAEKGQAVLSYKQMEEAGHAVRVDYHNTFSVREANGNGLRVPTVEIEPSWLSGTTEWPNEIEAV
jgi:hypothetical protein